MPGPDYKGDKEFCKEFLSNFVDANGERKYMNILVGPGDVVEISGYTGFWAMKVGLLADTFLEAMSITHAKKRYEEYVFNFYFLSLDVLSFLISTKHLYPLRKQL
ncbi:DNA replication licensing factor [Nymphaea thermarum]|nr:DNA replication licensing factor [Nymphaea thermarum]